MGGGGGVAAHSLVRSQRPILPDSLVLRQAMEGLASSPEPPGTAGHPDQGDCNPASHAGGEGREGRGGLWRNVGSPRAKVAGTSRRLGKSPEETSILGRNVAGAPFGWKGPTPPRHAGDPGGGQRPKGDAFALSLWCLVHANILFG